MTDVPHAQFIPHPGTAPERIREREVILKGYEPYADLDGLLRRCARREVAALEGLYQQTASQLLGVLVAMLRDRGLAEDALQEVFVRVWDHSAQYDAFRGKPMAWLVAIARNRAIDLIRARKTSASLDELRESGVEPAAEPLVAPESSATGAALLRCLGELSEAQQRCVELAYVRGLSYEEIAALLSSPLGTVKSWIRRALIALKQCLEP